MKSAPRLRWSSASRTHIGMVRNVNEDALLDRPDLQVWAVADGMGGHFAGDYASRCVVEALNQVQGSTDLQLLEANVHRQLEAVNGSLRQEARRKGSSTVIGSTAVVMLASGLKGVCLWLGDSRLYRLSAAGLSQVTRDHSQVQDWVDQGKLSAREAEEHPFANVITRAIGAHDQLQVDRTAFDIDPGDVFLLCSDGLTRAVHDTEIGQILSDADEVEAVNALTHLALVRGATDNVTLVVASARAA